MTLGCDGVCSRSLPQALEELLSWDEKGSGLSCFLLSNRSLKLTSRRSFFLVDQVSLVSLNVIIFVSSSVLHFTSTHSCLR